MGSFEEARAAVSQFTEKMNQNIGQLQGVGQGINAVHGAFTTSIGSTSQDKVRDVGARTQESKQKIAEAIQAAMAAKEAASQFATFLH